MDILPKDIINIISDCLPYQDLIEFSRINKNNLKGISNLETKVWNDYSKQNVFNLDDLNKYTPETIVVVSNYYNIGYTFNNEHTLSSTVYCWIVYIKCLFTLHKLPNYKSRAIDEINAFKRRITIIDFWRESNYDQIIYAIHAMLSIFDKPVRELFFSSDFSTPFGCEDLKEMIKNILIKDGKLII